MDVEKELLTVSDVCQQFSVSRSTLARWRRLGIGPPCLLIGPRTLRYRRLDVLAFERDGYASARRADIAQQIRDGAEADDKAVGVCVGVTTPNYPPIEVDPQIEEPEAVNQPAVDRFGGRL